MNMLKRLRMPLLLLGLFAISFTACSTPKYYDNVKKVFPAVVRIVSRRPHGLGHHHHQEGYVITSQHVVTSNKTVYVLLNNGGIYEAPVSGSDEASDLAFIKLPRKRRRLPVCGHGRLH